MKYTEIKKEAQERHNKLFNDCGVFWAFSNDQFTKQAPKGVKLTRIPGGGFMPKDNVDQLVAGIAEIKRYEKTAIKEAKAEEVILYELNNFEAFHSCDLTDALEVLKPLGYTEDQVRKVFNKHAAYANV